MSVLLSVHHTRESDIPSFLTPNFMVLNLEVTPNECVTEIATI